jgi:hypothetical protein
MKRLRRGRFELKSFKGFILSSFFVLAAIPAFAEIAEDEYIPMDSAIVQIMNKQAGKTQTFAIPVGKPARFEKLDILVRKCLGVNEFLPEDFFMFAEISKAGKKIFSGWMTRNEPGQNPLQDPDSDLWLVRCESQGEKI